MTLFAFFLSVLFAYALASKRLERTVVTGPIVFLVAGMAALPLIPEASPGAAAREVFLSVAEVSLVLLLFADASRTNLGLLREIRGLPTRLLTIGMLGTILLGALAAAALFPQLSVWQAGILAAILAPTDAGLGQVIVRSPAVPEPTREALSVEAGLNDGLSVPFLLFFMASAGTTGDVDARLRSFIVEQLVYGALIGAAIGALGGYLLRVARHRHWTSDELGPLAVFVLPLLCILASEEAGASMFIAAFVAGLTTHKVFPDAPAHSVEFSEGWGQLLSYSVFFLFGLIVAGSWPALESRPFVYALLSLTVVRMLPVAAALAGTGLDRATVLFMGWFGPRGLASIVLGLVYLEHHAGAVGSSTIRAATTATVLVSIVAHGLTAAPGIGLYGRSRARTGRA